MGHVVIDKSSDTTDALDTSDALDLQRLGLLTLAAMDMSTDRIIQLSQSRRGVYRVDVMAHEFHHTSRSAISLLDAMDNACDWLRRMAKPLGPANMVLQFGRRARRARVGLGSAFQFTKDTFGGYHDPGGA